MVTIIPIGVEQSAVYTIVGPRGDRAVFNDPTDPDYVGLLSKPPTGLERAAVRENAEDLVEADGGINGAFYRSRLTFTLEGTIDPDGGALNWITRQDRILAATDALRENATLTFTPAGGAPPVRLKFREQQSTRVQDARPKTFLIAGVSEDIGVEARDESVATISAGAVAVGGFTSLLTSPLSSTSGTSAGVLIPNVGRRAAWPLLRLYGPGYSPIIRNASTNSSIVLNYYLNAGDYLEIDTHPGRRSILLNGSANRYSANVFLSTTWWGLEPGIANDVRLGMQGTDANSRLDIIYRPAWG